MGAKSRNKAYKKDKGDRAKASKKDRKRTAVGKKVVDKLLDKMIFPRIVQRDEIDLELGSSCSSRARSTTIAR